MSLRTTDFRDYLQGRFFRKDTLERYYAEQGFAVFPEYQAFLAAFKADKKDGHICKLDEGLWVYQDKRQEPSRPQEGDGSKTSFQDLFEETFANFWKRFPHL